MIERFVIIMFFVLWGFSPFIGYAAIINVPGVNNYTIQEGLDIANSDDTVLVAAGTYEEYNINFNGKEIHLKSESGPDVTIIDGSSGGTVFIIISGETRNTIIEGFTVQNGYGSSFYGGGFYLANSSPTIRNNIITNNTADSSGGGIKASTGSNSLIENNIITNNTCYQKGGGIHIYDASAEIYDNTISYNTASGHIQAAGGGIGATYSIDLSIEGNHIEGNSVTFAGGGISVFAGNADIIDNDIVTNDGGAFAGGIHVESHTDHGDFTFRINDNYIFNNTGLVGGGINSFMHETASYVEIINNQVIENESVNPACTAYNCSDPGQGGGLALYSRTLGLDNHLVKDNLIQNNRADLYGGALLIKMPITFEANVVEANQARYNYGGASCVETVECSVLRNKFLGNYSESYDPATRNPGGLYVKDSGTTQVTNNFFYDNSGYQAGAAQFINCLSTVKIINNTFADNNTIAAGGATIRTETDTDFVNNIFKGDVSGIRISGTPTVNITQNNFHGQSNFVTINPNHTTVASLNGESFATGNTDHDPLLVSNGDYHLKPLSPCKDAGTAAGAPDNDIDGDSRPQGSGYDIGADEFVGKAMPWLLLLLLGT
jgi:parallel beta-helix repeat protein